MYHRRRSNKPFVGSMPRFSFSKQKSSVASASSSGNIQSGRKEEISIISLKIKNLDNLLQTGSIAKNVINDILHSTKIARSKIYVDGNYRLIIFSPIVTKSGENNIRAIRIAKAIEKALLSYNGKGRDKIDFGIGVNIGDMIVEARQEKFKFTSLGTTLTAAKKISENSNCEVLLSEALHRKTLGNVKSEKLKDKNLWRIKRITSREKHADFISNFVNRQKKEKRF